ncbi:MAG: DNA-binding protein [Cyanobacteria bacterium QS_9_48_30]|nr:MAG: DNA-binding protein [Cyanobacteria bacterium QS_9_48_30]
MDRVFLDANVLFSAAYKKTRLRTLWTLPNITLLSSSYAVTEAETNLARERSEAVKELEELLETVTIVKVSNTQTRWASVAALEQKDRPILLAAISAKATTCLAAIRNTLGMFSERKSKRCLSFHQPIIFRKFSVAKIFRGFSTLAG